jgi:hypothetical protein
MTDAFVRALEEAWSSLPVDLGSAWQELEAQMAPLLEQYRKAGTDTVRAQLAQQIEGLILQRAPTLWVRLDRAASATQDAGTRRPTRGWADGTLGWPETLGDPSSHRSTRDGDGPRVTRYTDISCPRFVSTNAPRVHVIVRLSAAPNPRSAVNETLELLRNRRVRVTLDAPAFAILNAPDQELDPSNPADSTVFDLRPLRPGSTRLRLTFLQDGHFLGQASAPVEIVAREAALEETLWPGPTLALGAGAPRPDWLLMVDSEDTATSRGLRYRLIGRDGVPREFTRMEFPRSLDNELRRTYEHLSLLALRRDPNDRDPKQTPAMAPEEVDRRTRALGQQMWRELIPPDLKAFYAHEKRADDWDARPPSLLLVCDNADIPWELVWPHAPAGPADVPWCERFRMARWLVKPQLDPQLSVPPWRLMLRDLACVIPRDLQLEEVESERRFLSALIGAHGLRAAGPEAATWSSLTTWLDRNDEHAGSDWLHLTAHGGFSPDRPTLDSGLTLEGGGRFRPPDITGEAERTLRRRRPGWLFNSCEAGRCTEGFSPTAGWAARLIEAGAGVFIAPAWAVRTTLAVAFTQAFYPLLLKGESLAGAVRTARLSARQAGDPSWLCYTLYGHPEARVDVAPRAAGELAP